MKKRIVSILLFLSIVASSLTFASCGAKESKNTARPDDIPETNTSEADLSNPDYTTVAETDKVKFEFNEKTTDIRMTNKKTGFSWSTEYAYGEDEPTRGEIMNVYFVNSDGVETAYSTATESVEKGQFKYEITDNGVNVQYGIGDVNFKVDFPLAISSKRAQTFLDKMDDAQKEMFYNYYEEIHTFEEMEEEDRAAAKEDGTEFDEEKFEQKKETYPLAENERWYYIKADIDTFTINDLHELFRNQLGYTDDDLEKDNEGVATTNLNRPEFNIQVNYVLDGDNLKVTIPEDKLYHSSDYVIDRIELHPHLLDFGQEYSGYFLLPDGSGSLMNFNNGKDSLRTDSVYVPFYGIDEARGNDTKSSYTNDAVFPVYGCTIRGKSKITKNANGTYSAVNGAAELASDKDTSKFNGMFATVLSGDTFAGVSARSADPTDDMSDVGNRCGLEFRINEFQKMNGFASSGNSGSKASDKYYKFQFQRYLKDISVEYHISDGDDATYSGMANYYSQKLFGDQHSEKKDYYSTVETMGLINGEGLVMGISYNKKIPMTTFDQVQTLAKELKSQGFNNMNIRLTGWCNGGYEHGFLDKVRVSKELGGEDKFKELSDVLSKENIGFYPDIDYQYVYAAESSVSSDDVAYTLSNTKTRLASLYDPISFQFIGNLMKYGLNSAAMERNLNNFIGSYSQYKINNLSLRSIGQKITANYGEDQFCERQETLENLVKQVSGLKDKGYSLMGSYGQAPFVDKLDYVNNIPVTSAGFDKTDYSIPFVPMVLSGRVQYTGDVINLSNAERQDLLQMIEAGAGAYYTLTAEQYDDIANSDYMEYYSTKYDNVKDTVLSTYDYLSKALESVYGLKIVKHTILSRDVNMVTYEDGTRIVVNYNDSDYSANGISCKANDYAVIKGA